MSKTYRPYEPKQAFLMPVCLQDWLFEDHLAYFLSDVVDELDLSAIMRRYEAEEDKPADKAQRNFTDPHSRIMPVPGGKDFVQAYNAQAAVDSSHQIIVAAGLTNQPSDKGQAVPLMEAARDNNRALDSPG